MCWQRNVFYISLNNLIDKFQFANLPFEREKNLLTKGFYDFTDIRKLQDKAKASHRLSAVFYEHIGFYPIGTHRFFMGRDNRTDY